MLFTKMMVFTHGILFLLCIRQADSASGGSVEDGIWQRIVGRIRTKSARSSYLHELERLSSSLPTGKKWWELDNLESLKGGILVALSEHCVGKMIASCFDAIKTLTNKQYAETMITIKKLEASIEYLNSDPHKNKQKINQQTKALQRLKEKLKTVGKKLGHQETINHIAKLNTKIEALNPQENEKKVEKLQEILQIFEKKRDNVDCARLLAEINICFVEKRRALPVEHQLFVKKAQQHDGDAIYFKWYFENALVEFIDLEIPTSGVWNGESKKKRKAEIRTFIEAEARKLLKMETSQRKKEMDQIVETVFEGDIAFQWANSFTVIKKLEESSTDILKQDTITQGWDALSDIIGKYSDLKQSYDKLGQAQQTADLIQLGSEIENTELFRKLCDIQEQIYNQMTNVAGSPPPMPGTGSHTEKIITDFSCRPSPKHIGRASIKCVRKYMKFDARKLKDCAGCLISVQDTSDLHQCKKLLGNFLGSLKIEKSEVFHTECAMVPEMDTPVRLMEIKHGSSIGYKDVKLIFQAALADKFYNFEIIFLLEELRLARSTSHVFYEFTRQFGVYKGKKTMDQVLLSIITKKESDKATQEDVETLQKLYRRTSVVLQEPVKLARKRRIAFKEALHVPDSPSSGSEYSDSDLISDLESNSCSKRSSESTVIVSKAYAEKIDFEMRRL